MMMMIIIIIKIILKNNYVRETVSRCEPNTHRSDINVIKVNHVLFYNLF